MVICVVICCSNRSDGVKRISFYRVPALTSHYGEREIELSMRRRAAFLAATSREDLNVNDVGVVSNLFEELRFG